jgi:hypothetical protein
MAMEKASESRRWDRFIHLARSASVPESALPKSGTDHGFHSEEATNRGLPYLCLFAMSPT